MLNKIKQYFTILFNNHNATISQITDLLIATLYHNLDYALLLLFNNLLVNNTRPLGMNIFLINVLLLLMLIFKDHIIHKQD